MTNTFQRITPYAVLAGGFALLVSIVTLADSSERLGRRSMALPVAAPTRIEVDNDTHKIRFYINGEQITMLDSLGLHEGAAQ